MEETEQGKGDKYHVLFYEERESWDRSGGREKRAAYLFGGGASFGLHFGALRVWRI